MMQRTTDTLVNALICFGIGYVVVNVGLHKSSTDNLTDKLILGRYSASAFAVLLLGLTVLIFSAWASLTDWFNRFIARRSGIGKGALLTAWLLCGLLIPLTIRLSSNSAFTLRVIWVPYTSIGLAIVISIEKTLRQLVTRPDLRARFVLFSCSLVGALLFAELGARVWLSCLAAPASRRLLDPRIANDPKQQHYVRHHYLNYALSQNLYDGANRHNSLGYRDGDEVPCPKPAGEYRIVTLGGSTTYDWTPGNDWRDSYAAHLEDCLSHDFERGDVRVINAGVGGYNSWESLINLEFRVLELEPNLIVIYHGTNDFQARMVAPDSYKSDNSGRRKPWDDSQFRSFSRRIPSVVWRMVKLKLLLIDDSNLESLVGQRGSQPMLRDPAFNPVLGMRPIEALKINVPRFFERNVRNMIAVAQANKVDVLLVTFVFNPRMDDYAASEHHQFAILETNSILLRLGNEMGIRCFDLQRQMPLDDKYWLDGVHMTKDGNRLRAEMIAKYLATSSPNGNADSASNDRHKQTD